MQHAVEVARHLLAIRAVLLKPQDPFTWASGLLSPIYCDNRVALSHPSVRTFLKQCLTEQAGQFGTVGAVAGVATAGIAYGALLADQLDLPFAYVRGSAKDHGRRNQIEGALPAGVRVLVVEDLISTGGSCLAAVEALRDAGCEVAGVLAIFQYGFPKAQAAFSAQNVVFQTLTNYDIMVQTALESGYIDRNDLDILRQWSANPEGWGALYA